MICFCWHHVFVWQQTVWIIFQHIIKVLILISCAPVCHIDKLYYFGTGLSTWFPQANFICHWLTNLKVYHLQISLDFRFTLVNSLVVVLYHPSVLLLWTVSVVHKKTPLNLFGAFEFGTYYFRVRSINAKTGLLHVSKMSAFDFVS